MIDKRFWGGAILAVTIVVAGASSLPALLLRPTSPQAVPSAPASVPKIAAPAPPRLEGQPISNADPLLAAPPPQAIVQPAPKVIAPPQPAVPPEPTPPVPAGQATSAVFPPVQPVGLAGSDPEP